MQVVPLSRASRAPNFADHSMVSRSNALSSFHQTKLRISPKELEFYLEMAFHELVMNIGGGERRLVQSLVCIQVHASARSRLDSSSIGNSFLHIPSNAFSAAATAPAVGTRPISPTPFIP